MKYVKFKEKLRISGLSEEDFSALTNTPHKTQIHIHNDKGHPLLK